jgi:hypothetical protein
MKAKGLQGNGPVADTPDTEHGVTDTRNRVKTASWSRA